MLPPRFVALHDSALGPERGDGSAAFCSDQANCGHAARIIDLSMLPKTVLGRGGELRASVLQLYWTIVSARSSIMRLPAISIQSWAIKD
jgi:hypothetical protein